MSHPSILGVPSCHQMCLSHPAAAFFQGCCSELQFPAVASLVQSWLSPLPSPLPVPGAACQGRLPWGQPRVWRSCQRSVTPRGPSWQVAQ